MCGLFSFIFQLFPNKIQLVCTVSVFVFSSTEML